MPKLISDKVADKLQPGQKVMDTKVTGFGVRRQTHKIEYFVKYRSPTEISRKTGKPVQQQISVGSRNFGTTAEKARAKALAILAEVATGVDPKAKAKALAPETTVLRFIAKYMELKVRPGKNSNTTRAMRRYLEDGEVSELLGHKQMSQITTDDVTRLFEHSREKRGVSSANVCYDCFRALFNYCNRRYSLGLVSPFQMTSKDRLRHTLKPRNKCLTDAEVESVRSSLDRIREQGRISGVAADCISLIMMTGWRRGEAQSLEWADVDLANGIVNLEDTKTGPSERVLSDTAWKFLKTLKAAAKPDARYVFPSPKFDGEHVVAIHEGWDRVRKDAGQPDMRLHDWRHNMASRLAQKGVNGPLIMRVGGWKSLRTMQRYLDLNDHAAIRAAVNKA